MLVYNRIVLVGIEEEEYQVVRSKYQGHIIWHQAIPNIVVKNGVLFVEKESGVGMLPVDKVVYYGIYENDFDFITGLALWNGSCFPNPIGMMDCRLKIPCLVKALKYSNFGSPRGFVSAKTEITVNQDTVAKWGNWSWDIMGCLVRITIIIGEKTILDLWSCSRWNHFDDFISDLVDSTNMVTSDGTFI